MLQTERQDESRDEDEGRTGSPSIGFTMISAF